jgi:hypothetical protein
VAKKRIDRYPVVPEMATEKPSVVLYEPYVTRKGFRIEDAADVAIGDCPNEEAHPGRL